MLDVDRCGQARGLIKMIAIHLARIPGETVAGRPPDHQEDPERDRNHWWKEIKGWLKQIRENGQSSKQRLRDLLKKFSPEELKEIRDALTRAAEKMHEPPPDFPSVP